MGSLSRFRCSSCGYETEVSGGDDCGFYRQTTTILCETCRELYDVVTHHGRTTDRSGWTAAALQCPRSKEHLWRLWQDPGPCPKCGAPMTRGELTRAWD